VTQEYWPIVEQVQTVLQGLAALNSLVIRLRPELVLQRDNSGSGDPLPVAIVAMDWGAWETVGEIGYEGAVIYEYPVLVGLVVANTNDQALMQYLANTRETIRNALFTTALITGLTMDVEYVPAPRGKEIKGLSTATRGSVQLFNYSVNSSRPNP
jgi:hypothetical protein